MSKKVRSQKRSTEYRQANFFLITAGYMLLFYIFLLLCLYPFLIEPGYAVTSRVKFGFLMAVSYGFKAGPLRIPAFVPLILLFILTGTIIYIKRPGKGVRQFAGTLRFSSTDIMVGLYGFFVLVSALITPYRDDILWGYTSWYMGLASQFLFIVLYFTASRFFDMDNLKGLVYVSFVSSSIVFIIGILQRFGADIFDLYQGLEEKSFISTIGQHTFFSSYMILFLMTGIFAVWISDPGSAMHRAAAVYLVIASCMCCVLNADMAFSGLFIAMSFLFVISFDSIERMKDFIEASLIILVTWRITGLVWYLVKPEFPLEDIPVFLMQSDYMWILIALMAVIYVLIRRKAREKIRYDISGYRYLGYIYTGLVVIAIAGLAVYIILNTKQILPEKFRSDANYLLFNARWGNGRGANWHDSVLSYLNEWKSSPVRALFGAGPDQFNHVLDDYVHDWMSTLTSRVATNAHNEWLTAFINYGLFGGGAYLGIFVSSIVRGVRNRKSVPVALGVGLIALAHFAHQLFGYQQFINAPYIFLILGIGEQAVRSGPEQGPSS